MGGRFQRRAEPGSHAEPRFTEHSQRLAHVEERCDNRTHAGPTTLFANTRYVNEMHIHGEWMPDALLYSGDPTTQQYSFLGGLCLPTHSALFTYSVPVQLRSIHAIPHPSSFWSPLAQRMAVRFSTCSAGSVPAVPSTIWSYPSRCPYLRRVRGDLYSTQQLPGPSRMHAACHLP